MPDFRTIRGLYIKHASSDPSNLVEGDIWYNTTTQPLKIAPQLPGTWAAGENVPAAVRDNGGFGTTTAAAYFGGYKASASAKQDETFEYDGTDYAAGGDLPNIRSQVKGFGTQTAGVCVGGQPTPVLSLSEEYNGSTWAEGGDLNTGRANGAACGTLTAGLFMGGSGFTNAIEEYDGSSWASNPNSLTTARGILGGGGTQTAAFGAGGYGPGTTIQAITEEYDGSAGSSGGNLNTGRKQICGAGTLTAGIIFGGSTGSASALTEEYDGSAWAASGAMGTGRYAYGASSNSPQTTAVVMAGYTGTADQSGTEEYTGGVVGARTADTS